VEDPWVAGLDALSSIGEVERRYVILAMAEAPVGQHTFDLRHATCGCSGTAEFSDRVFRIAPKP
jgi:hypothetical protein